MISDEDRLRAIMLADRKPMALAKQMMNVGTGAGGPNENIRSVSPQPFAKWDFSLRYQPTLDQVRRLVESHGPDVAHERWRGQYVNARRALVRERRQETA